MITPRIINVGILRKFPAFTITVQFCPFKSIIDGLSGFLHQEVNGLGLQGRKDITLNMSTRPEMLEITLLFTMSVLSYPFH